MGSLVVALYLFNQFGSLDTELRYESFHDCFEATAKLSVEANTDAQSFVRNMQDNPDLNWSNGRRADHAAMLVRSQVTKIFDELRCVPVKE